MPLKPGRSRKAIASNMSTLKAEGYPLKQRIAISLRRAGVPKAKRRPVAARRKP